MNNVHPTLSQALAGFAPKEVEVTKADYLAALKGFDWHFDFSDDANVRERGRAALSALRQMQAEFDPTGEIWMQHRPNAFGCPFPGVKADSSVGAA